MAANNHSLSAAYWRANLKILAICLFFWFAVSFGCGILLFDFLNQWQIGGYKLGFWFAQQGSIYCFVALIFIYAYCMNKLDDKYSLKNKREAQ
ncbi:DUF4212 domain-containing protein [Gayadomonas joobiniege]|uniref:DUF4212 domain-containing protein n=1 Tax=Gayadomonas joobiniege TaxID=1234606 RepID=UPI00036E08E4|nr:DUF4212 domain-containing protein [Gayadomonas joobiniege]